MLQFNLYTFGTVFNKQTSDNTSAVCYIIIRLTIKSESEFCIAKRAPDEIVNPQSQLSIINFVF